MGRKWARRKGTYPRRIAIEAEQGRGKKSKGKMIFVLLLQTEICNRMRPKFLNFLLHLFGMYLLNFCIFSKFFTNFAKNILFFTLTSTTYNAASKKLYNPALFFKFIVKNFRLLACFLYSLFLFNSSWIA